MSDHMKKQLAEDENRLFSIEEVIPDISPAKCLKGLRVREEITQQELAEKLDVEEQHISEMENNKRAIGKELAKKIEEIYRVSYKVFL